MGQIPPQSSSTIWRHLYAGTSLAITILVCIYAGLWVDRRWGVTPWGAIGGAVIGIGAGLYNFIREFLSDSDNTNQGA